MNAALPGSTAGGTSQELDAGRTPGGEEPAVEPEVAPETVPEATASTGDSANPAEPAAESAAGATLAQADVTMEEFLGDEPEQPNAVALVGGVGRALVLGGALVAIGGAVFAAFVIHGTRGELSMIVGSIRIAASLLVVGAVAELVAQLASVNGGWTAMSFGAVSDVVASSFGVAVALKLIGGWMMSRADVTVVTAADTVDPVLSLHQLVPVGAGPIEAARPNAAIPLPDGVTPQRADFVWRSHGDSLAVPIGIAAVLVAFLFDGHTVSEGNRVLTGMVDIVHVFAGAVWAGGLVMLAQVIWRRHRRGDDSRALELAVRFSVVAAIALAAAGIAGTALTFIIIDSISEIWSTSWGQLLMAKTVLVALAGLAGLYNHRVLIPKLAGGGEAAAKAEGEFRRAVSIEGAIIGSVVVATALLVAASSV